MESLLRSMWFVIIVYPILYLCCFVDWRACIWKIIKMIFYEERRMVMIQVNCVTFNMTAADVQSRQLGYRSLWACYTLGLNVWVGFEHLQVWVLTCPLVVWPNFDSRLRIICAMWTHECYFSVSSKCFNFTSERRKYWIFLCENV